MSEQPTFVDDDGDLRKYRTETPNMIYDMGLDPYEGWLYQHLKRIAGDSGVCWKGTRQLAHATGMSKSQVSRAKAELVSRQLISITTGDRANGQADEIRIANLWRENFEHFAPPSPTDTGCPSHEHPCPSHEHPCPSHEHKKEPLRASTEKRAKALSKKPAASSSSSSPKVIRALSDEEAAKRFEQVCTEDPHGRMLRDLSELLAEENKTGKVKASRAWRELGKRYLQTRKRHDLPEDAWRYGFEQALARGAPNIGYVLKAAKGYGPERAERARSIAVIGATEADYDIEEYRFHE